MQHFTFDHDKPKIHSALGISDETYDRVVEIIYFSSFTNYILGHSLYDNPKDIPKKLTTITGDLETALDLTSNDEEKNLLLLIFKSYHHAAIGTVAHYEMLNGSDQADKEKASILLKLADIKLSIDRQKNNDKDKTHLNPKLMMDKFERAKKYLYSFEDYYSKDASV